MPRLFVEVDTADPNRARLPADGARHLRALRLAPGDTFEAIVAPGEVRLAKIEATTHRHATVRLGETVPVGETDPTRPVVLAIALADLGRFDWVIEKATELGATKIVPVRAARSQIGKLTESRRARWQRIARTACEQCGRTRTPEIGVEVELGAVSAQIPQPAYRVVLAPEAPQAFDGDRPGREPLVLFVGPEGGFTSEEVRTLVDDGAELRSLGPRTLRFETAVAAALAIAGTRRR